MRVGNAFLGRIAVDMVTTPHRLTVGLAAMAAWVSVPAMAALLFSGGAARQVDGGTGSAPRAMRVYVGTYTGAKSKGIYQLRLDLASGSLSPAELAGETTNPSFLAIHPNRQFLYAVSEIRGGKGKRAAAVVAFAVATDTGKLTLLNTQPTGGAGACHLSVAPTGRHVLAANYGSGSVCALPIGQDGRLAEATAFIQHSGSGPNPKRQKGPHAHSINLDPAGRFALAADLGLDKILLYRFDSAKGSLAANVPPSASVAPGAGPRHLAFHPNGRFVYVINEMGSTVTAFAYDAGRGALAEVQTLSTLPAGFDGRNSTAEIQVHPSGRFVYGSNRGHDSIAIFAASSETGKLQPLGHQSTLGKWPRNFGIDPTGAYLLVANRNSGNVVVFRIDRKTGGLSPAGAVADVPMPVCVKFMPVP